MLFLQVILGFLMLATPFFIIFRYRLNILKKTVLALLKLSVTMILTAIFLQYLFEWNNVTANFMWILLMIGISAVGILRKARLQPMRFLIPIGIGVAVTSLLTGLLCDFHLREKHAFRCPLSDSCGGIAHRQYGRKQRTSTRNLLFGLAISRPTLYISAWKRGHSQ